MIDAICAPSNIRYPQDVSLLNEARENAEKMLDALHDAADGKKLELSRKVQSENTQSLKRDEI